MFSPNSKIIALCFAAVAVSTGIVHAEKEVAETFGLLGLPGVGVGVPGVASVGVGAPGYGYGVGPAVSVGVPGLASVGVGVGNGGVNVGANVLGVGANVGVGVPGVVGVNAAPSVGVNASPSVGVNNISSADPVVATDSHTYTTKTTSATNGNAVSSPATVTNGDGTAYVKNDNIATKSGGASASASATATASASASAKASAGSSAGTKTGTTTPTTTGIGTSGMSATSQKAYRQLRSVE